MASTVYRRASASLLQLFRHAPQESATDRSVGLDDECHFWDAWFETKGLDHPDEFRARLDPEAPLDPYYCRFITHLPQTQVRILDVGAGPLTVLGRCHPTKQVTIVATDVLAPQYDRLLERYHIEPPVRTVYAQAERLSDQFGPASFDLVHARNSIDHCADPLAALRQMLLVTRPGCYVLLSHGEMEGERQGFLGLHQWGFMVADKHLFLRGRDQAIDLTRALRPLGEVSCQAENHWVMAQIRRK